MSFQILCAAMMAVWLMGVAMCLAAIRWSFRSGAPRFWRGLIYSAMACAVGYVGAARYHADFSYSVNGQGWALDSKWFFLGLLGLGIASMGLTVWRRLRAA